jgi:Na+/H+-translocating membrane pyrophosphatase
MLDRYFGMGSDLFGSYAESSCATLVVASISLETLTILLPGCEGNCAYIEKATYYLHNIGDYWNCC